jgi:hypothetical protein
MQVGCRTKYKVSPSLANMCESIPPMNDPGPIPPFPRTDGRSRPHLRLGNMGDRGKICGGVNHHRGNGSIQYVVYLSPINYKLSMTRGTYVCCFTSDSSLTVLCPVLLMDRRREVVDKHGPMKSASKCWMWSEREVG